MMMVVMKSLCPRRLRKATESITEAATAMYERSCRRNNEHCKRRREGNFAEGTEGFLNTAYEYFNFCKKIFINLLRIFEINIGN